MSEIGTAVDLVLQSLAMPGTRNHVIENTKGRWRVDGSRTKDGVMVIVTVRGLHNLLQYFDTDHDHDENEDSAPLADDRDEDEDEGEGGVTG